MASKAKKPAAPRKKKANGYKMPAPIAVGEVIHDTIGKKKWRIGPSIGVGGFGEIYSACDDANAPKKTEDYPYVIKIEPHENGPLFVEKHFYVRNANKDDIAKFTKDKRLPSLGMPTYWGNGSHMYKGEKYRYLVLERYGRDLWSLFLEHGRRFPTPVVFQICLQMLDVLEYIHSRGYVHADVKGANILLDRGGAPQAYLVDFGLAARVNDKDFKPDPKCAHNGTIEYTSRDAHQGVATMRGDLEVLAYNALQWARGALPWEPALLADPPAVQRAKEELFRDPRAALRGDVPEQLIKFFEYIKGMKPKDVPDYTKCKGFFESYLKTVGRTRTSKLDFTPDKKTKAVTNTDSPSAKKTRTTKKKTVETVVDDTESESSKKTKDNGDTETGSAKKRKQRGATDGGSAEKTIQRGDTETGSGKKAKKRGDMETGSGRKAKQNGDAKENGVVKRRGRPRADKDADAENLTPDPRVMRQSLEPPAVVAARARLAPRRTPPAKTNHADMATQTSGHKPPPPPSHKQVTFTSPVVRDADSSGDLFDDSFTLDGGRVRRKRLSDEEYTVTRVVRRRVVRAQPKAKSWKTLSTVVNGRSPPK